MKYNDRISKTKVKTGKRERKSYPYVRWLLIGSLLIQSGFTVLPRDVETLDLVTQEVEQEEIQWLIDAINNHQLNDIIPEETIPEELQFTSEELKDEDGFVYYDIPLDYLYSLPTIASSQPVLQGVTLCHTYLLHLFLS